MKYTRFTEWRLFWQIGRDLLQQLLIRFAAAMQEKGLELPDPSLEDEEYFKAWNGLMMASEQLPGDLNEALHVAAALATTKGADSIRRALAHTEFGKGEDLAPVQLALKAWMQWPQLLVKIRDEQHLKRLSAFQYFERNPDAPLIQDNTIAMRSVVEAMDTWLFAHGRGRNTTVIDPFRFGDGDELWFLVRHGGFAKRSLKVEQRRLDTLHYRPAEDDVVVYSQSRDELRIHANTKGALELYRNVFSLHLGGCSNYFAATNTFSLEPIRTDHKDSLYCADIPGAKRVVLLELQYQPGASDSATCTWKDDDLFGGSFCNDDGELNIPIGAKLTHAKFRMEFDNGAAPVEFEVQPPNCLLMLQNDHVTSVHEWLAARGFRGKPVESAVIEPCEQAGWRALEEICGQEAVLATWKLHLGPIFSTFQTTFLKPLGRFATHVPSAQGCRCRQLVKYHDDNSIVALANEHCGLCENRGLTLAEVSIWGLNWKALGNAIAHAWGCIPCDDRMKLSGTRRIGTFAGRLPVILSVQSDYASFLSTVHHLVAKRLGHCILLAPTRRFLNEEIITLLAHENIAFFDLASNFALLPPGKLVAFKSGGELLSPHLPEAAMRLEHEQALQIIKLVGLLASDFKTKKGRLIDVFNFMVLKGFNQKQTAGFCGCPESTIFNRVKTLEAHFNQPLSSLQALLAGADSDVRKTVCQQVKAMQELDDENSPDKDAEDGAELEHQEASGIS